MFTTDNPQLQRTVRSAALDLKDPVMGKPTSRPLMIQAVKAPMTDLETYRGFRIPALEEA